MWMVGSCRTISSAPLRSRAGGFFVELAQPLRGCADWTVILPPTMPERKGSDFGVPSERLPILQCRSPRAIAISSSPPPAKRWGRDERSSLPPPTPPPPPPQGGGGGGGDTARRRGAL